MTPPISWMDAFTSLFCGVILGAAILFVWRGSRG